MSKVQLLQINTRIEQYQCKGINYLVKREDMACPPPGPPFAKVRGLYPYLKKLKQKGIITVGYMDTAISMAGWGISYFAKCLNMKAVIFYPQYKNGYKYNQEYYIRKWEEFGAIVLPLEKPTRQKINVIQAEKIFKKLYPNGNWIMDGLRFKETIHAVREEAHNTFKEVNPSSIIVSVGSGIMLAGILQGLLKSGFKTQKIIGVLAHKEINPEIKKRYILGVSGFEHKLHSLFLNNIHDITNTFEIMSGGYNYQEKDIVTTPFPCNPYYDLKAFEFMESNIFELPSPILFWNIGA